MFQKESMLIKQMYKQNIFVIICFLGKGCKYEPCLCNGCSSRNSPPQSAIAERIAEANSVFIVITLAKRLPTWLFPSKIYIRFTICNTYFSTKLSFTNKRYHLHVLKCLYVIQEVRSIIYVWQFIHPLSLHSRVLCSSAGSKEK